MENENPVNLIGTLTPRQKQMLRLIGEGYMVKQISHQLGLAERTVNNHVAGIKAKLKARNMTHAAIMLNRAENNGPTLDWWYNEGRRETRAKIVAWLRDQADEYSDDLSPHNISVDTSYLASLIEREVYEPDLANTDEVRIL